MSQIQKLQIEGIRSYREPAVIEFFTPLTLIVGLNGAGKTTIIEALNYITTGDMPPNSKGAAFVFDPKVAGEQEVKGQVKLMLKDISGHRIIATRSLVSTQKLKKIECKSLENVIKRHVNEEWHSVSSKCADINKEMINCLGVSKPVLDCVIFCHQEDSLWPLSEGKVLKTKFDDIFAATRYIKALEAIRKFRKEQATEVKKYKSELEYLKANRDKAEEIAGNLDKTVKRLEEAQQQVDEIQASMTPVESRLRDLSKVQQTLNDLERNLDVHLSNKKSLVDMNKDMAGKIMNYFEGSKQELKKFFREFESKVKDKETKLTEVEENVQRKDGDISDLTSKKNSILVNHGKLQQEAERHTLNIEQRDSMMMEQSKKFGFQGFDAAPFSPEKVLQFMEFTKEMYQKIIKDGKESKQAFQDRINLVQSKIDDIKKMRYQYEETIRIKTSTLGENQRKLKQIGQDLSNVDASAKKLQRTEKELNAAEKELDDTKASGNVGEWKAELDKSQTEKRKLDVELTRLREEQQAMHLNSTTQTKLDMKRKQKEAKEDAIQKVIDKHEEELRSLFGASGPTDTLKSRVSSFLKEKRTELKNNNINIQTLKQQQSSKQAEQKMIQYQIENFEKQKSTYSSKLKEACGDQEYNTLNENLYNSIEQAKSKCSQLQAFQTIFKKYITTMEEKQEKPCCPLCHRQFNTLKEMQNLVDELKEKIRRVPEKMTAQQTSLERDEKSYEQLQNLRSVKDNLEEIEKTKLPSAKEQLRNVSEEYQVLQNQIEELEDVRAVIENEESDAAKIEPDLVMLEENQRSLKLLDKEISLLQAKMEGVAPGRNMQLVTNEISDCQDKVDGLSRFIERKRSQISQQESRLSTLTSNVHELNSVKLRLSGELQRRSHLEEQKAELTATNMDYEREVKEAKRQLEPVKEHLMEHEKQKKSLSNEQQDHVDQTNEKLDEIKSCSSKFRDKIEEIGRYVDENRESVLETIEAELKLIEEKINKFREEKRKLTSQMDTLKDDLSQRKVRVRELQDNIKFVENQDKISELDEKINEIKERQESVGDISKLRRDQNNLMKRLEEYRKQKATCEGMQTGFEREIRRFQSELESSLFKDAEVKHRRKLIEIKVVISRTRNIFLPKNGNEAIGQTELNEKTTELANDDLDKYYKALDRAIMKFHSIKMSEINKIVKEYWTNTYKGNDIDTIEIRSDEDLENSSITSRRSYNYKVVMIKGDIALDMRGRCSAGQKVLASLIIRLALAETFCLNCGVLTLDEPTTNLDEENIESLAHQLASIVQTRNPHKNFQLVVITHDEHFVDLLSQADFVEYYYRVAKDETCIYQSREILRFHLSDEYQEYGNNRYGVFPSWLWTWVVFNTNPPLLPEWIRNYHEPFLRFKLGEISLGKTLRVWCLKSSDLPDQMVARVEYGTSYYRWRDIQIAAMRVHGGPKGLEKFMLKRCWRARGYVERAFERIQSGTYMLPNQNKCTGGETSPQLGEGSHSVQIGQIFEQPTNTARQAGNGSGSVVNVSRNVAHGSSIVAHRFGEFHTVSLARRDGQNQYGTAATPHGSRQVLYASRNMEPVQAVVPNMHLSADNGHASGQIRHGPGSLTHDLEQIAHGSRQIDHSAGQVQVAHGSGSLAHDLGQIAHGSRQIGNRSFANTGRRDEVGESSRQSVQHVFLSSSNSSMEDD